MAIKIQLRRDTSENWLNSNPVLAQGEMGLETNTNKFKFGDGETAWNSLQYFKSGNVDSVNGKTGVVTIALNELASEPQMDAIDSGITSASVGQISTNQNAIGTLSNLETTAKTDLVSAINEVDAAALGSLQVSDIVDNTTSTATNKPLSANMGKSLQDQVDNLSARGRFLALWNCATGLAQSNPPESPYTYKSGDYFIVGTVASGSGTNYKPNGSSYTTGVASTTVETAEVAVDDVYYYDGTNWRLQVNTQKTLAFVNIAGSPYDNTNLASALNSKQDELTQGTGIAIDTNTNTISNSGVRSVSTGSTNGTISVNTNGTSAEVSVHGLGTAAFTSATDYAQASALNDYVTLNTVQTITAAKSIVGTDYGTGMQKNIFAALSTESSAQPGWKGRMLVGAKDLTFLMGSYGGMAGLGAHSWTDSAAGTGAAWADFYLNPDGAKTVYIGGYNWKLNSGWFRVQNSGATTNGKVQVNVGSTTSTDWKDVAYKGENVSDFNDDIGIVKSVNNITPVNGNITLNAATFVDWVD